MVEGRNFFKMAFFVYVSEVEGRTLRMRPKFIFPGDIVPGQDAK